MGFIDSRFWKSRGSFSRGEDNDYLSWWSFLSFHRCLPFRWHVISSYVTRFRQRSSRPWYNSTAGDCCCFLEDVWPTIKFDGRTLLPAREQLAQIVATTRTISGIMVTVLLCNYIYGGNPFCEHVKWLLRLDSLNDV